MKSKLTLGLGAAMLLSMSAMTAGTAFADAQVDSPGKVQADTTQLNYTGQGTSGGQIEDQKCGDNADFGSGNDLHGATADNYILWIFNAGGTTNGDEALHVNGDTYTDSDSHQIVTPGYDVSTLTAYMSFTVNDPGNGSWVLTISHGCFTKQDQEITPQGSINGPCSDPAYYAVFDNSQSNVTLKFRMVWYTTTGVHTKKKDVPGGSIYTTYQHWAKPGTWIYVGYKDPNTGVWTNLASLQAAHGNYPPCDFTPGWSSPVQ